MKEPTPYYRNQNSIYDPQNRKKHKKCLFLDLVMWNLCYNNERMLFLGVVMSDWYRDYLQSEHWKNFRKLNIGTNCFSCGGDKNLQLHHKNYKRVGKERKSDVVTLCDRCHGLVHELNKSGKRLGGCHRRMKTIQKRSQGEWIESMFIRKCILNKLKTHKLYDNGPTQLAIDLEYVNKDGRWNKYKLREFYKNN